MRVHKILHRYIVQPCDDSALKSFVVWILLIAPSTSDDFPHILCERTIIRCTFCLDISLDLKYAIIRLRTAFDRLSWTSFGMRMCRCLRVHFRILYALTFSSKAHILWRFRSFTSKLL